MVEYKIYLEKEKYAQSTIESYDKAKSRFIEWCTRQNTNPIEIDYKTCLKYIKHLTRPVRRGGKGNSKKTVNHKLGSLKAYFNYLVHENYRAENPIESTTVKGVVKTIHHSTLESEELEDLYYSYESDNVTDRYQKLTAKRSKIIVGFIVYQGLNTTDLANLEIENVHLNKGKIYVPSTKRSNARELDLKPWQFMEVLNYINEVRPELQHKIDNYTEQFFPTNTRFTVITSQIIKKLKRTNHKVKNVNQLRASVITNWLKQHNLRKVQYLSGHRYISSTERYLQDDLENLQEIINNFHPLR